MLLWPVNQSRSPAFGLNPSSQQTAVKKALPPWDVRLHKNQVWNRLFIESFGYYLWSILFARNPFERLEKGGDLACWVAIGIFLPLALEKVFNGWYSKQLKKKFQFTLPRPLGLAFEELDDARIKQPAVLKSLAKKLGSHATPIERLPLLLRKIRFGKLALLFTDLFFMASKGQVYFWGKNWVTEKLSGKKGFSGELSYASNEYLQYKTKDHEKNKRKKLIGSLLLGYGGALALPLILYGLLRYPKPMAKSFLSAKGILSKLKTLVPHFNYTDVIYMSKWVIQWHFILNWNIPGMLSARDSHEMREHLARSVMFDFFYFFGDGLFAGLAAKWLQKRYRKQLKLPVLTHLKLGKLRIPQAVPVHEMFEKVQGKTGELAFRLSRWSFWTGILATTAGMGIATTLLNNWYTQQKVLREEKALARQKHPVAYPNIMMRKPVSPWHPSQATLRRVYTAPNLMSFKPVQQQPAKIQHQA